MKVEPIKTRILNPPQDDLLEAIQSSVKKIPEQSILVITSKVVSIWEGRCVPIASVKDKDELIKEEADRYVARNIVPEAWVIHTIKNNLFIPSAGIDASNSGDYYTLWPKAPYKSAQKLWKWLKKKYKIKNIGVIITDSHSVILRRGTIGISIAHYGFNPLKDYRGHKDLFDRKMLISQLNIADGLASSAVVTMGENTEQTPLALITGIPWVQFTIRPYKTRKPYSSFEIKTSEDVYYPLIKSAPWRKGGEGIK